MWNMRKLALNVLSDDESCLKWVQEMGLVPANLPCATCAVGMKTRIRGRNSVYFECRMIRRNDLDHTKYENALRGTFFENSKLGLRNIVTFMYYFSINQKTYEFLRRECMTDDVVVSSFTVSTWLFNCREVCLMWIIDLFDRETLLGGPDVAVEIVEAKIGETRNNKPLSGEGISIVVMMEIENIGLSDSGRHHRSGRFYIELCLDNVRDESKLIPLVLKHVKPGTVIVTDLWKTYFGLTNIGYSSFTVDHDKNIISPLPSSKSKIIESTFMTIKKSYRTGLNKDHLIYHLAEYLYRKEVKASGIDPFEYFLKAMKHSYSI